MALLLRELEKRPGAENLLVHTGQHYDEKLSRAFFDDLEIREPDANLGVGSGSHVQQTAGVMQALEPVFERAAPNYVVVVGDVNSTLAAALAGAKMGVPVAHVEAGLRSGDLSMPEELNRIVTDRVSKLLFAPSREACDNLRSEGIPEERVYFVGNIMIDSLMDSIDRARELNVLDERGLSEGDYAVATLHRPSNVDGEEQLAEILEALEEIAASIPVIFPVHPRTRERMEHFGFEPQQVRLTQPVGYLEMLALMDSAAAVLTDSGGIQEETTALGVPCLTLRDSTERPVTVKEGTNRLVPTRSREAILDALEEALRDSTGASRPELWDGNTAPRIADLLLEDR